MQTLDCKYNIISTLEMLTEKRYENVSKGKGKKKQMQKGRKWHQRQMIKGIIIIKPQPKKARP